MNYEYPDLRDFPKHIKKYTSQRMRRGFADCDTWNLDTFLIKIIIRGLRHLADTTHGWPQSNEFPTYESWIDYLLSLADKFELAEKYIYDTDDYSLEHPVEEWAAREKQGTVILGEAFNELSRHFTALWD